MKRIDCRLYLVRHGQTDWNVEGRLQGHTETSINQLGKSQAKRNGLLLAEFIGDRGAVDFVSSPLLRARQTMEAIREAFGLERSSYSTDDRLSEIDVGNWAGKTFSEVASIYPQQFAKRQADPWAVSMGDGETFERLSERVCGWLKSLKTDTVAVSHGGVCRCVIGHYLELPFYDFNSLIIPQDRVLKIDEDGFAWL